MSVDGVLNVLKPAGITSFAVVSRLRHLTGEPRVGHAGTLDPEATGVLVVCFGQGTRIVEFLAGARKSYKAEVELGVATDSYDASGKVVHRSEPFSVSREQVEGVLRSFYGSVDQIPPMYSAIRYKGKRLYQLARKGIEVPRKPRRVQFFRLELLEWRFPTIVIEVECSGGTYIRSLAHDIGLALGCGAHLGKLIRLKSEPFDVSEAVPLALLEEASTRGCWQCYLYAVDEVLLGWEAAILDRESESLVANGRSISLERSCVFSQSVDRCRAYSTDGRFLAVLRRKEGLWHPEKVFHLADGSDTENRCSFADSGADEEP